MNDFDIAALRREREKEWKNVSYDTFLKKLYQRCQGAGGL